MDGYRILSTPLPLVLPAGYVVPEAFPAAAARIWATAETKVRELVTRHPTRFPLYTEKGRWADFKTLRRTSMPIEPGPRFD